MVAAVVGGWNILIKRYPPRVINFTFNTFDFCNTVSHALPYFLPSPPPTLETKGRHGEKVFNPKVIYLISIILRSQSTSSFAALRD